MRVVVVGAGGVGAAIASIASRRSFFEHLVLADLDIVRAGRAVDRIDDPRRFSATRVDATDTLDVVELARESGADVVVNACDPRFNPPIFEAALAAGCHYIDMAMHLSHPHATHPYHQVGVMLGAAQLDAAPTWIEREQLALVGMGVEPGLSDVFARYAADHQFTEIDEIGIRDGGCSATRSRRQASVPPRLRANHGASVRGCRPLCQPVSKVTLTRSVEIGYSDANGMTPRTGGSMKRTIVFATAGLFALAFIALPAGAQVPPYPPRALIVTVSDPTPSPGQSITVSATGCLAGETIAFSLSGAGSLGSVVANANGAGSVTFNAPTTAGTYTVVATCGGVTASTIITVAAAAGGGGLPFTGSDVGTLLVPGVAAIAAGALLIAVASARRTRRPASPARLI